MTMERNNIVLNVNLTEVAGIIQTRKEDKLNAEIATLNAQIKELRDHEMRLFEELEAQILGQHPIPSPIKYFLDKYPLSKDEEEWRHEGIRLELAMVQISRPSFMLPWKSNRRIDTFRLGNKDTFRATCSFSILQLKESKYVYNMSFRNMIGKTYAQMEHTETHKFPAKYKSFLDKINELKMEQYELGYKRDELEVDSMLTASNPQKFLEQALYSSLSEIEGKVTLQLNEPNDH